MKKKEVENEAYFTQLILYIHNNPVKHGFVKDPFDWPYSSIHQLTGTQVSKLNKKEVVDWFGDIDQLKKEHRNINNMQSVFG